MMDYEWYEKKPIRKWHQMSDVERRQELEMISHSQLSKVAIPLLPAEVPEDHLKGGVGRRNR